MKKISRICFITLVFMSATLPSYSAPCFKICPSGSYTDTECQCKTCPAKYYCPGDLSEPILCPKNYYCPSGQSEPILCPVNYYCPSGQSEPIPCPENYYCPGGQSEPIACPNGQTSPEGSDSEDDCVYDCTKHASSRNEEECKRTGFCGFYDSGVVFNDDYCKACNTIDNVNKCSQYAGCYWIQGTGCTPCPRGYYCISGSTSNTRCEPGQISQQASYSKDDCYFDCVLYNDYKAITELGVEYAQKMCKAAPGCYWNENTNSCEYCPVGYYCDNTENGLVKQKCPLNSTSDPKSTKKLDCYLGSSNKICDSNNVCYRLDSDEKIYYWQTFLESGTQIEAVQFPNPGNCYLQDPLPCS